MKKIISLFFAAAIMAALPSCGLKSKLTAFGLYSRAAKTFSEAGGFEAEATGTIDMGFLTQLLGGEIESVTHIKKNGVNSNTVVYVQGQKSYESTVYDGYSYTSLSSGTKVKAPVEEPETVDSSSEFLPKLAEEVFEGVEVVENSDGTKTVATTISGDVLNGLLGEYAENTIGEMTISSADMEMIFDESDDLKALNVAADIKADLAGTELEATVTMSYSFINFGTAPEILPPEDIDEYVLAE